jgi:hypothetical protein
VVSLAALLAFGSAFCAGCLPAMDERSVRCEESQSVTLPWMA